MFYTFLPSSLKSGLILGGLVSYMRECELGHHDINLDNDEVCSL